MEEPLPTAIEGEAESPAGVGQPSQSPLSYAAATLSIVKLDTETMVRVSHDPMALLYGAVVFVMTTVLSIVLGGLIAGIVPGALTLLIAPFLGLILSMITTGVVHLVAKMLFGTTGTLVRLLRVLWLGSIVSLLGVIPIAGSIVAGIWSLLITMVTFQEVDGIERLQALGLSIGVSFGFFALGQLLSQYVHP